MSILVTNSDNKLPEAAGVPAEYSNKLAQLLDGIVSHLASITLEQNNKKRWIDFYCRSMGWDLNAALYPILTAWKTDGAGSAGLQLLAFGPAKQTALHASFAIPIEYRDGMDIVPRVFWLADSAAAGNVRWELEYTVITRGGTFPVNTTVVGVTAAAPGVANQLVETVFTAISDTTLVAGGIVVFAIRRWALAAPDTYPTSVYPLQVAFEIRMDKDGVDNII